MKKHFIVKANTNTTSVSQCSFDFSHHGYDTRLTQKAIEEAFIEAGVQPIGVDFRSVDYSQYHEYDNVDVSQCGVDFEWSGLSTYYEEAIEDEGASALDSLGMELLGISFYSIDE